MLVEKTSLVANPVPIFAANPVSNVPSAFNLVRRPAVTPLKLVKLPPTSILPSDWMLIDLTVLLSPVPLLFIVKMGSSVPG